MKRRRTIWEVFHRGNRRRRVKGMNALKFREWVAVARAMNSSLSSRPRS